MAHKSRPRKVLIVDAAMSLLLRQAGARWGSVAGAAERKGLTSRRSSAGSRVEEPLTKQWSL